VDEGVGVAVEGAVGVLVDVEVAVAVGVAVKVAIAVGTDVAVGATAHAGSSERVSQRKPRTKHRRLIEEEARWIEMRRLPSFFNGILRRIF